MHAASSGATVPRVTLYVKDSDSSIWKRAKKLSAGSEDSLSSLVTEGLEIVVERRERQQQADKALAGQLQAVELTGVDFHNEELERRLRFKGTLVIEENQMTIYVTQAKKIVVAHYRVNTGDLIEVFEDFDEFKTKYEEHQIAGVLESVADALGEEYFEELE